MDIPRSENYALEGVLGDPVAVIKKNGGHSIISLT